MNENEINIENQEAEDGLLKEVMDFAKQMNISDLDKTVYKISDFGAIVSKIKEDNKGKTAEEISIMIANEEIDLANYFYIEEKDEKENEELGK
jgi:hypothetical protein